VHTDASSAVIRSAKRQVGTQSAIVGFTTADGQKTKVVVERGKLEQVLRQSKRAEALSVAEKDLKEQASQCLASKLEACFQPIKDRSSKFADWYFAYPTTFRLLREACTSVLRHSADISRSTPLHDAVAADMEALLMQKYERIVLQPELNDTHLQEAFLASAQQAHRRFCSAASDVDNVLVVELAKHTSHLEEPTQDAIRLDLDWAAQLHKIKIVPTQFEKVPELTLALSMGGALAGKAASAAAGSKVAGTLGAKAAGSAMGKFGGPFITKALAAGSGAAAGLLAGPLGAVVGGAAGLGADFAVNLGLELLQREDFEREVERVLQATQRDYFKSLEAELHRAISVWVSDAIHLLPTSLE